MKVGLLVLGAILAPTTASAATTVSSVTTTGETLTISIGYPGDGYTQYGRTTAYINGAATLRGGTGEHTSIERIAVGFGDAYETPGSTYVADARREFEGFTSEGQIAYEGTRKLFLTVIAADGTRATANVTLTLEPRQRTGVTAFGALSDWRLPQGSQPALRAALYQLGEFGGETPILGAQISFYNGAERICDAVTGAFDGIYATCTDPVAIAKVVPRGDGYTAVFRGSDSLLPSKGWGPLIQTSYEHIP